MFRIQAAVLISCFLFASCATSHKQTPEMKKASLLYSYGTKDLSENKIKSALEKLKRAFKYDSNNSDIANNLGMAYYLRGDKETGESFIRKALELNDENSDARMNLATIELKRNNLNESEKIHKTILKDLVYRHQYRTYYNLSIIAEKKGDVDQAKRYLELALKENKNHCAAGLRLGLILRKQKRIEESLEQIQESSFGTCYSNPRIIFELGEAHYLAGEIEKSLFYFKDIKDRFHGTNFYARASKKISKINKEMGFDSDPTRLIRDHHLNYNKQKGNSKRVQMIGTPKF